VIALKCNGVDGYVTQISDFLQYGEQMKHILLFCLCLSAINFKSILVRCELCQTDEELQSISGITTDEVRIS